MKKAIRFSILVITLVSTQTVFGQINVGLTAGANFATVSTDNDKAEYGTHVLFALGGVFEIELNDRWSLRVEPMYLGKGADPHFDLQEHTTKHKSSAHYLELPVLFSYSFAATETLTPFLTFGPSVGFKLGAHFHALLPGGMNAGPGGTPVDISDKMKLIDAGIALGIGTKVRSGNASYFIQSRYTFGLTNVEDRPDRGWWGDGPGQLKVYHRGLQVLFGYTFPL